MAKILKTGQVMMPRTWNSIPTLHLTGDKLNQFRTSVFSYVRGKLIRATSKTMVNNSM